MKLIWLFNLFLIASAFPPAFAEWYEKSPMPTARSEMPAAYLVGAVYVPGGLGGLRRFETYDINKDRWVALAQLPAPRHHLMSVAHKRAIYLFGGADADWRATQTAWRYDASSNRWFDLTALPEPRSAGAAVVLGDYIYIAGGNGPSGKLLRYDPGKDSWLTLAPTRVRREHTAAVAFDAKLVVIGGRYGGQGELTSVEIYDVQSDTWSDGPPIETARGGHAAVVHRKQIMILGGEVILSGRKILADTELLDHLSGEWRPGVDLPLPLHGMPAASSGDALYVLGGSERAGAVLNRGKTYVLYSMDGKH